MPKVPETVLINEEGIKEIIQEMDIKAKEPKGLPLAEFLEKLKKPVQKMLAAGYKYSDISRLLKQRKIHIPAAIIQSSLEAAEYIKIDNPDKLEKPSKKPRRSRSTDVDETLVGQDLDLEAVKTAPVYQANGFNVVDKSTL